jgi:hypothetical protein
VIEALQQAMASQYQELPEAIRTNVTYTDWAWLSDAEKARLQQSETEPEGCED